MRVLKPLKLLCHGLLNLEFVLTNKPAKDRLAILVKPVVPPLLSRILASERNITAEPVMARALTHLSKVIDGNFTDEEKSKIARLVWREFDMIYANYGPQKAFFSLFHVMTLFVELGVNEQQEKGYFPWVDSFVVRWIDIMRCDAMKLCRMKMLMHLYFVFIGLNNGKYDIIYGQKERWSNALRETKSFLDNKEIENLKKYVEQVPLSDKTGQRLVDELNLLFK
uniref:Uncharacterized protein n=1 Tax=Romanomermis culicivorax TaxID=13658 RepID=A0A915KL65_ROMCU